ncbi:MAG: efflux RND transporter periplasmic adaptor subunit, partial [Gemmatimonadota bacterium]|nr:efflux RND transporter periplasmic adaptor subunit [Gemmatimonadota bacterium]
IPFLKEQQWSMPFDIAVAEEREIRASIPAPGELVAPPRGLVRVVAPMPGLVLTRGPAPAPGDRVRAGQALALLAPTSADDSYARLRADVEALRREVARAERLYAAEAIPERRLVEARHELDVALAALETVGGTGGDEADASPHTYALRSPIDGVIAERHVAAGERLEAGGRAFTVVDPRALWLRLRVPARRAEAASGVTGAWFTAEGGDRRHRADRVVSIGSIIDPGSRTVPIYLAIERPDPGLKVGMLAEGHLFMGEPIQGVAIPASAIQGEDGLEVAYVKVGGEAFQRRVLDTGPTDGTWTLVRSGVEAGEQVVTEGAYQVMLASLGDAEISDHGHPH